MGTTVTISRQFGSGGEEVACNVAAELDLRVVGRNMVHEALQGCVLEDMPLDAEQENPNIVQSVLAFMQGKPAIPAATDVFNLSEPGVLSTRLFSNDDYYRSVLESIVYDMAKTHNVLIIGQAGQVILRDDDHAFHIRIVAPLEQRIRNIQKHFNLSSEDAQRKIKASDQARSEFLKKHYNQDIDDAGLYDLIINTRIISTGNASRLIVDAVRDSGLTSRS